MILYKLFHQSCSYYIKSTGGYFCEYACFADAVVQAYYYVNGIHLTMVICLQFR